MKNIAQVLLASLFCFALFACTSTPKVEPVSEPVLEKQSAPAKAVTGRTLHQRLGGKRTLVAIAQNMLTRLEQKAAMKAVFQRAGGQRVFKQRLYEFLCVRSGGSCVYAGNKDLYEEIQLTPSEQKLLLQTLSETLNYIAIPKAEQQEFLDVLVK